MQRFFIAAPGTGVGKTFATAALAWQLSQAGKQVTALKPVISGYDANDEQSDTAVLLKSCGISLTKQAAEAISPWQFVAPLAPDMAAAKEKKLPVDLDALIDFCRASLFPLPLREGAGGGGILDNNASLRYPPSPTLPLKGGGSYVLVESVGGIMTPVNNQHTVLDWMAALGWPVIMVGGSYLGAISHTLMALDIVRARNLPVKGLIVSESQAGVPLDDTVATLEKFVPKTIPLVKIPRIVAPGDVWKQVPPIGFMYD